MAIDLTQYSLIQSAQGQPVKIMSDLVAIANLEVLDSKNLDTKIHLLDNDNDLLQVEGDYSSINEQWAIIGHEIVFLEFNNFDGTYTTFDLTLREHYGTKKDTIDLTGFYVRTVTLFPTKVKDFSINEDRGNQGSPFTYSMEDGWVTLLDSISNWKSGSPTFQYNFRKKKSVVYLFLGFSGERILKNVMFPEKMWTASPSPSSPEEIKIFLYSKWFLWDTAKIKERKQLKNVYPKELFSELLNYNSDMIYYGNGNLETDFVTTNNLFIKEYDNYGEIFQKVIKNGLYCYWDELERLKITTTVKIDNLTPSLVDAIDNTSINNIQTKDDDKLIINKVTGTYYQRENFQDFESINNKYLDYRSIISGLSYQLLSLNVASLNYDINTLTVTNLDLYQTTLKDEIVTIKDTLNDLEFNGKIMVKIPPNQTEIAFINYDKDGDLFLTGKLDYLLGLGYDSSRTFNLHYGVKTNSKYVERMLPIVYKLPYSVDKEIRSSDLKIPLLPQITDLPDIINTLDRDIEKFGGATNLIDKEYTGEAEEIDSIYGTFTNAQLLYNKRIEQFANTGLPPIFMLSTTIVDDMGRGDDKFLQFDTFDNRDIEVTIGEPKKRKNKAGIVFKNTKTINSSQILTINPTAFSEIGNVLIEVSLSIYNQTSVGDVLKLKQPVSFNNTIEENLFNELRNNVWTIVSVFESSGQYYIRVNSNIPKEFELEKYPYSSIVYLNEFYIRGNPILQSTQGLNEENLTSIEIHGEKSYNLDGKLLSNEGIRTIADFLNTFASVQSDFSDTRQILPVKIVNYIELQKYDIVKIVDTKYTGIDDTTLWMCLGSEYGSSKKGNEVTFKFMNINTINADPLNINLPTTTKFDPLTAPQYNHQGNEGLQTEVIQDLDNIVVAVGDDDIFGRLSYSEIPLSDLSAKVASFNGVDLVLNNVVIGNSNYNTFLSTVGNVILFKIEKELIAGTVSDWDGTNSTITVIKRQVCQSPISEITVGKDVQFQDIISGTIEGKLISSSLDVGDANRYIRFDVENGVEIRGTVEITSGDTYNDIQQAQDDATQALSDASNAQTTADGKNTIWYQTTQPSSTKNGDIWIDTNDENEQYRYQTGTGWVRDQRSFAQTTIRMGESALPSGNDGFWVSDGGVNVFYFDSNAVADEDKFLMRANGNITFENTNNRLFFDGANNKSTLLMNVTTTPDPPNDSLPPSYDPYYDDFSMHIGDKNSDHIAFNTTLSEFDIRLKQINMIQNTSGSELVPFFVVKNSAETDIYTEFRANTNSTFIGANAGKFNEGVGNVGIGDSVLLPNTFGDYNTALGFRAMFQNYLGEGNVAVGFNSLFNNYNGDNNVGLGSNALFTNDSGSNNIAIGTQALYDNDSGINNIAIGVNSLTNNTTGQKNIAIGDSSLLNYNGVNSIGIGENALDALTTGTSNIGIGTQAGGQLGSGTENILLGTQCFGQTTSGSDNIGVGVLAGYNLTSGSNVICIGSNAQPSGATVSNEITLGDSLITTFRCQVALTVLSDERDKFNIDNLNLGLNFIKEINPISYYLNDRRRYVEEFNDGSKKDEELSFGFSAQNLLKALNKNGIEKSNLVKDDNKNKLEVTETKMIPINTQAIKDLNNIIDNQQKQIDELRDLVQQLLNK